MLQIYNTLTRAKAPFTPITPGQIKLYVCGMTVYDYCHLGHARLYVDFDMITRYLRASGYKVQHVRNITDIDDKIIARAEENGESAKVLAERFIEKMDEDFAALGIIAPDLEPKATETIAEMIDLITTLIDKGYAYAANNGDVYYRVEQFAEYGKLSGKNIEDLRAGARVEINEEKQSPLDFVLWKAAKPGEPSWLSPWGEGRPGWHTECSAMTKKCLGETFDIHGGGPDLKFPHHENEIAQSEAANGKTFVNTWMHVGLLRVDDEKMSKSLHNFTTVREALADHPAEVIRYFLLASHYRSPINYSDDSLNNANLALQRFYLALRDLPQSEVEHTHFNDYKTRFNEAMDDDFNTPEAFAVLFDMAREVNRLKEQDKHEAAALADGLKQLADVLGLLQGDPEDFLQAGAEVDTHAIDKLVAARDQARLDKNWGEADRIRDELTAKGVVLEDGADGTQWRLG